jgi:hypothetical protein
MSTLAVDALSGTFERSADKVQVSVPPAERPLFTLEHLKSGTINADAGTPSDEQNPIAAVIIYMDKAERSGNPDLYAPIDALIEEGRAAKKSGALSFDQINTLNMLTHWTAMSKVEQAQALTNAKTAVATPGADGLG